MSGIIRLEAWKGDPIYCFHVVSVLVNIHHQFQWFTDSVFPRFSCVVCSGSGLRVADAPVLTAPLIPVRSQPGMHIIVVYQRIVNCPIIMHGEIQERPGRLSSHPALILLSRITNGNSDPLSLEA